MSRAWPPNRLLESHLKVLDSNTKTQPTIVQPPPAAVATTVQATTATVGATLVTTQSSSVMGQPLFPGLPSMGAIPAVSIHQASQRPSSALTATKRSGQTPTSGQPTKKVRIVASGIEAITAPTDASQPVTVTIACTVVPIPTQSSSSGSLSHVGTGLQPPPSLFQQRPTSTSATYHRYDSPPGGESAFLDTGPSSISSRDRAKCQS